MATEKRQYYKEVRLRQVRALMHVARHGSFAAAARELALSAPSVWQQIRSLEREFGASLVQAQGADVRLTADGELLLRLASPLVEGFDSLRSLFVERRGGLSRSLTLATTTSLLTYELAAPIARYRKAHPEVELRLIDRPSLEALKIFGQSRADVAIIGHAEGTALPARCQVEDLAPHVFHLVCLPGHSLLTKRRLTLEDIARHPLILPGEGTAIRERLLKTFAQLRPLEANVAIASSNLGLATSYVEMGYGVGILALGPRLIKHWGAYSGGRLAVREVSKIFGRERVIMLHRCDGREPPHVEQFRETVMKAMMPRREFS